MTLIGEIYYFIYGINFMTLLGSILTIVIFSRRIFEKNSIRVYCQSLALFDLYVLVPFIVGFIGAVQNISITTEDDFWCKFVNFVTVGISPIPAWILVVFSFDRLVTVSMTKRFEFFKKKWFQYGVIVFLFVFHCALYSPAFVLIGRLEIPVANGYIISCDTTSLVIPIIYLFESSFIPFVIIIITTSLIVRALIKSRNRTSIVGNRSMGIKAREIKFAFNSVVLNILFLASTSPLIFHYIFPDDDYLLNDLVTTICFVFFYLNFALHFWVHLFVNSIFRNQILIMFKLKHKDTDVSKNTVTKNSRLVVTTVL